MTHTPYNSFEVLKRRAAHRSGTLARILTGALRGVIGISAMNDANTLHIHTSEGQVYEFDRDEIVIVGADTSMK